MDNLSFNYGEFATIKISCQVFLDNLNKKSVLQF
jgi:hypothetical protein